MPLTATPALHLSFSLSHTHTNPQITPHFTSQRNLTKLNLSTVRLHPTKPIVSPIPFQFPSLVLLNCNLADFFVGEERCVFLLSSCRSCLNIDRDGKCRWPLSQIWKVKDGSVSSQISLGEQRTVNIEACESWGPCRCSSSLHYPPAWIMPRNVFQWRLEGDGV